MMEKAIFNIPKNMNRMQLATFGLLKCLRMRQCAVIFFYSIHSDDIHILDNAFVLVLEFIKKNKFDCAQFKDQLKKIDEIIPDVDEYKNSNAPSAQQAIIAVCHLLEFIIDDNVEDIHSICESSHNLIDLEVQFVENLNPNDPDLEHKILHHQFMIRELKRQEYDIKIIFKENGVNETIDSISLNSISSWEGIIDPT